MTDSMQEVKSMREVPRDPMCCGQRMTKMSGAPMGALVTIFSCGKCGAQQRVKPVAATHAQDVR